jgi:hypothetical protein
MTPLISLPRAELSGCSSLKEMGQSSGLGRAAVAYGNRINLRRPQFKCKKLRAANCRLSETFDDSVEKWYNQGK